MLEDHKQPPDEFYLQDIHLYEVKPSQMAPSMIQKVQSTITFVDEQSRLRKQSDIATKRRFQDPALYENDSDDEKPPETKKRYGEKPELKIEV